jgi:hypothetical protein
MGALAMTDAIARIKGQIEALREELRVIPPHRFNGQKIADRQRGVQIYEAQLARIEAMHQRFLDYRAELVARHHDFARKGAD